MSKGSTKQMTRETVLALKRHAQQQKEGVWKTVAARLEKPRRGRVSVNLWNLEKMAEQYKGKTFVVAGKVLGSGRISHPISVAGLEFSGKAREKIEEGKGNAMNFSELMKRKPKASELIIVG